MKTILLLLLLCAGALAKDPPVFAVYAVLSKPFTDKSGTVWYTLYATDKKGNKILVGLPKEALDDLNRVAQPTAAISY